MGSFRPDPKLLKKYPNAVTVPQLQQKDRIVGALLGLGAGEAVGCQTQGLSAADAAAKAAREPGGEPGSSIDAALAVLRSLTTRRKLEVDDAAQGLLRWFGGSPRRVPAIARAALENLRAGESHEQSGALAWEDAGRDAPDNAALVWVGAPVGLSHLKDSEGLADDALALCRVTHYDPRSVAGCAALATAISLLVRGDKDAEEAIPRAASAAAAVSDDVRAAIERGAAKKPDQVIADEARGSVLSTLELAFSALASGASVEEGVCAVAARGGDADLNAAVAGALLGAKLGKGQVPERWLKGVKAASELASLADALNKLAS